ncbi:16S rRNA (cytosine(967)-C(5))-methyltransferase RsmB [Suttonella ornithocola]|uniref:16S rRNA (cytosine(967)-C(5))-methyltransferase n=1 Tax=Suttonella ornithocola TaxID=279832 RepID=A0A380MQW1_9GAMM|nr:16S rRNA (cytosine(967)-C(5))-methyltransferase RsmB [Suttonella ornithocola]SUO94564.1 Ribosomal RNA small subunit methyltransferase B [Suttonella ornithocola]
MNARQAALNTLYAVILEQESLNTLLAPTKAKVRSADRALYQALVYGALREYPALVSLRNRLLKSPLSAEQPQVGILLNLGIYQLLRMDLGDHGVINETVSLAAKNRVGNAKGLINAILRRVQRERENCLEKLNQYRIQNLPIWLASAYKMRANELATANLQQPPLTIRIRDNREQWLQQHSELGYPNLLHPQAVTLHHGREVNDIPGFIEGQISVQDAAAQQAASLLAPKNGERILDACAAPGGKTGHLLELAPEAYLTALDNKAERLSRVEENLNRLQLKANLIRADASELKTWWNKQPFDAILLDAPCSGSGILRRHPDIAFLRTAADLKQLPKTQMRLLRQLWQTLKPGGRLLYTTCSILPRENQQLIEQFLLTEPQAQLSPIDVPYSEDTGHGLLRLPDAYGDGFFYALLHKQS